MSINVEKVMRLSYCCGALNYQEEDKYCPVKYSKKWREYSIQDFSSTSKSLMRFCPNCGTRLPSSLRDVWFDILEQEYGLNDPMDEDKKKIPKEFLTDEWWKKRGLLNNAVEADWNNFLDRPERCLF
jgi:hypothetical protein